MYNFSYLTALHKVLYILYIVDSLYAVNRLNFKMWQINNFLRYSAIKLNQWLNWVRKKISNLKTITSVYYRKFAPSSHKFHCIWFFSGITTHLVMLFYKQKKIIYEAWLVWMCWKFLQFYRWLIRYDNMYFV